MPTADPNREARLEYAFGLAVNRSPDMTERTLLGQLLDSSTAYYRSSPRAADQLLAIGIAPRVPELDPIEVASWTSVARAILNLSETTSRN